MIAPALDEQKILEALRQVIDPELDCNIVDLGLIYGIQIDDSKVTIKMTLTTPGCPMHESIAMGVQAALLNLDAVSEVVIDLVWDPPWNPAKMTSAGRAQLGISDP